MILNFRLYDREREGEKIGDEFRTFNIIVDNGLFNLYLDFGPDAFGSGDRWLETDVRCPTGTESITTGYTILKSRRLMVVHRGPQGEQGTSTILEWGRIDGIPDDIRDGDGDTLADLSCTTDQVARWDGSQWVCSEEKLEFMIEGPFSEGGFGSRNSICFLTEVDFSNINEWSDKGCKVTNGANGWGFSRNSSDPGKVTCRAMCLTWTKRPSAKAEGL